MNSPYIIIGNGVAGVNAAEAIRAREPEAPVILLSEQECEFYSRPSLYYVLLGRIEFADAAGRPAGFYSRNRFELRCDTKVSAINPQAHAIRLQNGEELTYRRLLLATGTSPRILPWVREDVEGFINLNTLADVVEISHAVGDAHSAVVVGGGLTSIELVESLAHAGLKCTFIMRDDRFLAKQLTPREAKLVHARLRQAGIDLRTEEEVSELAVADGRVQGVATRSGDTLPCQIVGVAAGIAANRGLAETAGAEVAQGIVVDEQMRTTLPDVFAAGDCAQVRQADGGPALAEMLWYVAARMGQVAGANMAGDSETYRPAPFLNVAEFSGLDFCGVGSIYPEQPEVETLWAPDSASGTARVIVKEGRIIGACFLGDIRLGDIARGLIARGTRWAELSANHPLRARFQA